MHPISAMLPLRFSRRRFPGFPLSMATSPTVSALPLPAQFIRSLTDFSLRGAQTVVDGIRAGGHTFPRFTNEFWTAGQRQGYSLHEISYRACFKSELPRFFITRLTAPGDVVYDPFMGRGTTVLEAALLGRIPAGNDINPLCEILLRPRLSPPSLESIAHRLDSIDWNHPGPRELDLSMFFSARTQTAILSLRRYLEQRRRDGEQDDLDRWIRMVATNRLTGHSAGFFSVYTLPPNQAVTPEAQRKINRERRQTPPDRDVAALILRKSKTLLKDLTPAERATLDHVAPKTALFSQDARSPSPLPPASIQLVVTSPPFLAVVQYARDNWLRCWFNGIDTEAVGRGITRHGSPEKWTAAMRQSLTELHRVLKPGGWVAFEVGEVLGGKVRLDELIAPAGIEAGFSCHGILINRQNFTKTAHCWGVDNNSKGTNTNRIVLFEKQTR